MRCASGLLKTAITTQFAGPLSEAIKGADVFIGVSAPNVLTESNVQSMAKDAIVFALANPDPEIDPTLARKHVAVVATGRSDQPNQIIMYLPSRNFPWFVRCWCHKNHR